MFACSVAAAQPRVTIVGGADATGHSFDWTVDHDHSSPMVSIEFPNHRADLFIAPFEWSGTAKDVDANGRDRGVSVGEANGAGGWIYRGTPARFQMRISPYAGLLGVRPGPGAVRIRFADGLEIEISAEVPVRESWLARQTPLVGAVLVILIVVIRRVRGRNRRSAGGEVAKQVETAK
ncbi:MAG: hypothetical protein HOP29_01635 [Phycisphaerales bacterium]|nr:hypothetical protein [Phycisphaerales bacterium]